MSMKKSRNNKTPWWVAALIVAVVATGCSNDGCIGNGSSIPLVGFYDYLTKKQGSVLGVTVKGIGAPGDSLLADSIDLQQLYLPLQVSTNSSSFVFDFNVEGLPPDTLTLHYEAVPYFLSNECGAMYLFNMQGFTVTHNMIDSVALPYPVINNEDKITIKIYL
jgi:hypothetical protein